MIVPALAIGIPTAVVLWKKYHKPAGMTPQRKKVFNGLLKNQKDPTSLQKMADAFHKEGLKAEANILRLRAKIFSASPEQVQAKREVVRKAMASKKPEAVKKVAAEFHKQGHFEVAQKLRDYANGLIHFKAAINGEDVPGPEV